MPTSKQLPRVAGPEAGCSLCPVPSHQASPRQASPGEPAGKQGRPGLRWHAPLPRLPVRSCKQTDQCARGAHVCADLNRKSGFAACRDTALLFTRELVVLQRGDGRPSGKTNQRLAFPAKSTALSWALLKREPPAQALISRSPQTSSSSAACAFRKLIQLPTATKQECLIDPNPQMAGEPSPPFWWQQG